MLGDDCQTWGSCCFDWALTCLKASSSAAKNNRSSVQVNWDSSNSEKRCYYITLYWVTTLQSACRLTSRWALQAWGCVCIPGTGSTLRRAGLKPEHSPWEDCITATQGFPTMVDRDLPLCTSACVCVTLYTFWHTYPLDLHTCSHRGAPLFTTDHIFIFSLFIDVKSDLALRSLAAICKTELSMRFGRQSFCSPNRSKSNVSIWSEFRGEFWGKRLRSGAKRAVLHTWHFTLQTLCW